MERVETQANPSRCISKHYLIKRPISLHQAHDFRHPTIVKPAMDFSGVKYVLKKEVLKKVPYSSYRNGVSLHDRGESTRWARDYFDGYEYLLWDSLTPYIQGKIGNIHALLEESISTKKSTDPDELQTQLETRLEFAFNQKKVYEQFGGLYRDRYFYPGEIEVYCRMHSFVVEILSLKEIGHDLKTVYAAFDRVKNRIPLYNFRVSSYEYFSEKLLYLEEIGLEKGIVHGNRNMEKINKLLNDYVKKQVIKFYCQNKPCLKYSEITEKVNNEISKRGFITISLSLVKLFLRDPEIQNLYKPFRLGKDWVTKYYDPFQARLHPQNVHDKWEMDGTVLPYYFILDSKITRVWYIIIVDVNSRKIISWAVGLNESRYLILECYRIAITSCKVLPVELVRDNAGGYDTKEVLELETKLEDLKCFIRPARPKNSKDKGTVEKVHDILNCDHFSKDFEHFIGDPWNAERELYRKSSVEIREMRKVKNAYPASEAPRIMESIVSSYNNRVF
ncbi:MAG: transposase family protein [Cytophagales bacterium]|jgi:hypothetical protein|nr:transposase family protein [Cytophagales bacterium]MCA6387570.1 transposase family protein [Cytophagales bacterium]MCA6390311.1 transposase family protein [Cytophagales bacterium]MCA6399355.1 transposase family protein [Cytophagales bacterium]MCA6400633.1 transposase family protein [Cytophagales bacterium]